jgi:hypothetical protein
MASDNKKQDNKQLSTAIVSDKVRSYSNDPNVVKKADESKAFLEKHGFPKELMPKK